MPSDDLQYLAPFATRLDFLKEFPLPDRGAWRAEVERLLKGADFDKKMLTRTIEGITLRPLYVREDTDALDHLEALPGFAPFVRGRRPAGPLGSGWEIVEDIRAATPAEFNALLREGLAGGATAVHLRLDEAARRGFTPARARLSDVGHGGVTIDSAAHLARALVGVDLRTVPVHLHVGAAGAWQLGFLLAVARREGVAPRELTGSLACDPLGELAACGSLGVNVDESFAAMAAMTAWAIRRAPGLATIWVHGEPYHEGGAHAAQELGCALATAVAYLREMESRGVAPDGAAHHMRWSLAIGPRLFPEIAKLRAARLLWHRALAAAGVADERSGLWLHAQTSRRNLTRHDPYVNLLRGATAALAAVVGGADSVLVAPYDEVLRAPSATARRLARNVQLIIEAEAHLDRVVDHGGGSWYLERLTADLAASAWTHFQEIERRGGMIAALAAGYPQVEIAAVATERAKAVATAREVLVGTNRYPDTAADPLAHDPEPTGDSRLAVPLETATDWPSDAVARRAALTALAGLTAMPPPAGAGVPNSVPDKLTQSSADDRAVAVIEAIGEAAWHGATVDDLAAARSSPVHGQAGGLTVTPIPCRRAAAPFETLRGAVTAHQQRYGAVEIFLATLGPVSSYMPRLDFTAAFFEIAGFAVRRTDGHATPSDAVAAAVVSQAAAVAICGTDAAYVEDAVEVARMVKERMPGTVVILAGLPADEQLVLRLRAAGVEIFIHAGVDLLATLGALAVRLGVAT